MLPGLDFTIQTTITTTFWGGLDLITRLGFSDDRRPQPVLKFSTTNARATELGYLTGYPGFRATHKGLVWY